MISSVISAILTLLNPEPNHPLNKDVGLLHLYAHAYVDAGNTYDIDPVLLVVWSFYESSLRPDAQGALNEVGLFQVHGLRKRTCKQMLNIDTVRGQIFCGAMLISEGIDKCGNLKNSLWSYASGLCMGTPRAKRITRFRLKKWKQLKSKSGHGSHSSSLR